MTTENGELSVDFRVLCHHIYEYNKGLRSLVLHTMCASERQNVESFLSQRGIEFCIQDIRKSRINVFFGNPNCVEIVRGFSSSALNLITDEEDFMLGIMLGYDRMGQCERYLRRRAQEAEEKQREVEDDLEEEQGCRGLRGEGVPCCHSHCRRDEGG
ncbi:MAG: hypothetical protein CSA97_00635 [Bacteroidetes bacterium]|nr:MAG: hypothetical protein CSA97_00635 [Bacteroidota bacterium]